MGKDANRSHYLYLGLEISSEILWRTLLICDQIHLPWEKGEGLNKEGTNALQAGIDGGRIKLIENDRNILWENIVNDNKEEYCNWCCYFSEAICKAFVAESVDIIWHDGEHRISWAFDNGKGLYPHDLITYGLRIDQKDATTDTIRLGWIPLYRDMDDYSLMLNHLRENNNFGAYYKVADYAISAATIFAAQKILLDNVMNDLVLNNSPYSRFVLLAEDRSQLKWVRGIVNRSIEFDINSSENISSIVEATLGKPTPKKKLSSIPIDRFLDLCEGLAKAKRDFESMVVKWSSDIAAVEDENERNDKLKNIRNNEIIPSMIEFNDEVNKVAYPILKAISGQQYGTITLGAFASGLCYLGGLPIEAIPIAGISGVLAGVAGNIAKEVILEEKKRSAQWMAFASALSDEVERWNR